MCPCVPDPHYKNTSDDHGDRIGLVLQSLKIASVTHQSVGMYSSRPIQFNLMTL